MSPHVIQWFHVVVLVEIAMFLGVNFIPLESLINEMNSMHLYEVVLMFTLGLFTNLRRMGL